MESSERIQALAEAMIQLFAATDLDAFHAHSYEKAKNYLTSEVEKRWALLLK